MKSPKWCTDRHTDDIIFLPLKSIIVCDYIYIYIVIKAGIIVIKAEPKEEVRETLTQNLPDHHANRGNAC